MFLLVDNSVKYKNSKFSSIVWQKRPKTQSITSRTYQNVVTQKVQLFRRAKNRFYKVKVDVHFRMNLCYFKMSYLRGPNHKTLERSFWSRTIMMNWCQMLWNVFFCIIDSYKYRCRIGTKDSSFSYIWPFDRIRDLFINIRPFDRTQNYQYLGF